MDESQKNWFNPSLFRTIGDLDNLLLLFASVLLERSIVCVGDDLHYVTSVIKGLQGLVRPMQWCFAIMPIVPIDLIDKIEAPVPMLAGLTDKEFYGPL
jgi:hypothetical protein